HEQGSEQTDNRLTIREVADHSFASAIFLHSSVRRCWLYADVYGIFQATRGWPLCHQTPFQELASLWELSLQKRQTSEKATVSLCQRLVHPVGSVHDHTPYLLKPWVWHPIHYA